PLFFQSVVERDVDLLTRSLGEDRLDLTFGWVHVRQLFLLQPFLLAPPALLVPLVDERVRGGLHASITDGGLGPSASPLERPLEPSFDLIERSFDLQVAGRGGEQEFCAGGDSKEGNRLRRVPI